MYVLLFAMLCISAVMLPFCIYMAATSEDTPKQVISIVPMPPSVQVVRAQTVKSAERLLFEEKARVERRIELEQYRDAINRLLAKEDV